MSIFPLKNYLVVNYPTSRSLKFKSGMVLLSDSNGYAIKADRSTIYANSNNYSNKFNKSIYFKQLLEELDINLINESSVVMLFKFK